MSLTLIIPALIALIILAIFFRLATAPAGEGGSMEDRLPPSPSGPRLSKSSSWRSRSTSASSSR